MNIRRAHQCTHPGGCDSESKWTLDLGFMTVGNGNYRHEIKCHSNIRVCALHIDAAMKRVVSPANRSLIAQWMARQNLPVPDFSSVEILMSQVDHAAIDDDIASAAASAELETELRA